MPLLYRYQLQFHYVSQILVNNRQKTSADGICLSLHVMSIFTARLWYEGNRAVGMTA